MYGKSPVERAARTVFLFEKVRALQQRHLDRFLRDYRGIKIVVAPRKNHEGRREK